MGFTASRGSTPLLPLAEARLQRRAPHCLYARRGGKCRGSTAFTTLKFHASRVRQLPLEANMPLQPLNSAAPRGIARLCGEACLPATPHASRVRKINYFSIQKWGGVLFFDPRGVKKCKKRLAGRGGVLPLTLEACFWCYLKVISRNQGDFAIFSWKFSIKNKNLFI